MPKPEDGMATLLRNLEASTGKSIDEWITIARATGLAKHKALVDHIKAAHGLTHGYANQIALRALAAEEAPAPGSDDLVDAQFAGAKAAMRPAYDALASVVAAFGPDVAFSPKKAYVSRRRSKQFGILQVSTAQRLDVGLVLKGVEPAGRLEASGSFNTMCTHRVRVGGLADVDGELVGWLRAAYEDA